MSQNQIDALLKSFAKLKQRVVMKWETDTLAGKPENVLISKWLPQDDVLAHPNVKLFISHCGMGGLVESKYHGVPILGLPLFGDQPTNADNIVSEGWGLKLDITEITESSLTTTINGLLSNPKYAQTVKKLSELARDRPMNARDTAVFWIEYVLRHKGAPHMHYPGADLNILQYNSIDVILFIVAVLYTICKLLKLAVKKICFRKNTTTITKRKRKVN